MVHRMRAADLCRDVWSDVDADGICPVDCTDRDTDASVTSERAFGLIVLAMALAVLPVLFAAVLLAARLI